MKIIGHNSLVENVIDHPYKNAHLYDQSTIDYVAKVNFFYISEDKKVCIGYWEAPEGWFDFSLNAFNETDYIIDGELDIISNSETFKAKSGDCVLLKDGDKVRFSIKKLVKAIFFIYPVTKELTDLFDSFMNKKPN
jgi:ethanolamine utilization protein EutQ (cupin superfamily)